MPESSSVEERAARIRDRMQWILSQLDSDAIELSDAGQRILLETKRSAADTAAAAERSAAARERAHAMELERLRASHESEVAAMRAELTAARETARQRDAEERLRRQNDAKERAAERLASEATQDEERAATRARTLLLERALSQAADTLVRLQPLLATDPALSQRISAAVSAADAALAGEASPQLLQSTLRHARATAPSALSHRETSEPATNGRSRNGCATLTASERELRVETPISRSDSPSIAVAVAASTPRVAANAPRCAPHCTGRPPAPQHVPPPAAHAAAAEPASSAAPLPSHIPRPATQHAPGNAAEKKAEPPARSAVAQRKAQFEQVAQAQAAAAAPAALTPQRSTARPAPPAPSPLSTNSYTSDTQPRTSSKLADPSRASSADPMPALSMHPSVAEGRRPDTPARGSPASINSEVGAPITPYAASSDAHGFRLFPKHYAYTHPGGCKPQGAINQDKYFVLRIDACNQVFGVFDGHGGENGELVAKVAADTIQEFLRRNFDRLRSDPETTFNEAFETAHIEVRRAILEDQPDLLEKDGVLLAEWVDDAGKRRVEAADGGTTATVIALVDGSQLVHAQVGDSTALLGGHIAESDDPEPEVTFEELIQEHSATNAQEYERVLSTPRGGQLQFVYDVPELVGTPQVPTVFKRDYGGAGYMLDPKSQRMAEAHGTPAKNVRGDLPAVILTPEEDGNDPMSLAMTRTIGDFYMQTYGLTWKPEVISVDLSEVSESLNDLTLIICTDGVWDLWEYMDAFNAIVPARGANGLSLDAAKAFFESTLTRGDETFGDTADNMTGIIVYLGPEPDDSQATAEKPSTRGKPAAELPASCFSV